MQAIPQDYQPEKDFSPFADGKYKAKGIKWFSLDDRQNPVLVYQKGDGRMVARCRFVIEDKDSGPPMSLEINQVPLLVRAFGADLSKMPSMPSLDSPGLISQYLTMAGTLINDSTKVVSIEVSNGWVDQSGVVGMDVTGYIYFKFKGVPPNRKTGRLEPIESRFPDEEGKNRFFFTHWEVIAGEGGSKSPFEGAVFTESNSYAIVVKDGKPDWQRTDTGNYTAAAVALANMMRLTAEQMFVDSYESKDPYNVLPEWNDLALANGCILKGERSKSERGKIRLNWSSVQIANLSSSAALSIDVSEGKKQRLDQDTIDARARDLVKSFLSELTDGEAFVKDSFTLTDAGSATAKTYLKPLKAAGVLSHGIIKNLTFDEVKAILDNISVSSDFSEKLTDYKHNLAAIGIGDSLEEESDDADF